MLHLIKNLIKDNETITKQETEYLLNLEYKTDKFYGIPKIHKSSTL